MLIVKENNVVSMRSNVLPTYELPQTHRTETDALHTELSRETFYNHNALCAYIDENERMNVASGPKIL